MKKSNCTIFLNGRFISEPEARIPLLSPGFLYGYGLFETMRSYDNNKIVYLEQHLERMRRSAKLIGIKFPYSSRHIEKIIRKAVILSKARDVYVKLLLSKSAGGGDFIVIASGYKPPSFKKYQQGFSAGVSSLRQQENNFFSHLKSINYLFYQLAYQEARRKGFDEALILNNRGYLCEGSRSNLFFARDSELHTPTLTCGCLEGVTRKAVFDIAKKHKISVYEGNFTLRDLYSAEEVFLTNSLMGIMPLSKIENKFIGRKNKSAFTGFFIKQYAHVLTQGRYFLKNVKS